MRNIIGVLLIGLSVSCSNKIELDGNWVISEMRFNGKSVYPNTVSKEFSIEFNVAGYEGAEKLSFQSLDSTIILPGFDSEKLLGTFSFKTDKIGIKLNNPSNYTNSEYDLAKEIYLGEFEIIKYPNKYILGLKSNSTGIKLINEDYLLKEKIDDFFNY
ncbi:hypothetical protein [Flagellimonas iocasae]|uniref:Lipocalin-like domain-containing protein n=1 Tax=Flagellimonas iocasae TaxID=2055905 RepID=A0ABW4Y0R5_9FLAO